ncbi:MAG: type III-B CRISPR module RAMP protein Cmr6 [Cyanobacteria bacterium]|nr:type III-B CRISPR module RAMP protein Cmr6 [Cyanobacteria bacterium CG_2015-16_32_12]NCO78144.1 type III-B CRISPR module RAMP protein Cmr6 [Cyanobacteria bacterium CG_2015-22_32_23]NCQ04094.1 type III-B CRISPR module RAMP protein Cmr6 [Cyanobacteria bacterium CG_2015-09_32_10]NCQ42014.1 type III-B CRISPR module RAMP protein Cmr6 [Cyanobacteria bacterium CG_2015-04_32_10]NCS83905.1 type III-B CRISPR module RAMP protein Cmr6 [Cyanobacteria bacterium CG_2015-02_32_10]
MTYLAPKPKLKSPSTPSKTVSESSSFPTKKYSGSGGSGKPPTSKAKKVGESDKMPNPWLFETTPPTIDNSASFVEYLRWMRSPDYQYKDGTKVEILHKAQEKARNYSSRLNTLNQRTKLMAEVSFEAKSTWRLRVGGHRGPENILLPAFDALGMPYLPSSSLRGVARNYGIRELMHNESITWKEAENKIAPYFGSIDTNNKADQAGKVVFFDAYPKEGSIEMDMANNIWTWENNNLKYSPNPNPFLSLKDATFVIGLRLANNCKNQAILKKVKNWLINGLQEGIGSQINSGYGQLKELESKIEFKDKFLRMDFSLKGQLIHGSQKINNINQPFKKDRDGNFRLTRDGKYQYDTYADEEVRSTAFKSMLRYWFRVFTLGVLSVDKVQEWESKLFGLIQPRNIAWVKFNLINGRIIESDNDECDQQKGTLILSYTPFIIEDKKTIVADLFNNLIWLTFRLGGVGQGARRSYYERNNNPYYRGSKIYPKNPDDEKFWTLTKNGEKLCIKFKNKIKGFYRTLEILTNQNQLINNICQFSQVTEHKWTEVVDSNCKIILISGTNNGNKPFALNLLHGEFHRLENNSYAEAKSLCGGTKKERNFYGMNQDRDVMSSPIWTNDLKLFEVVTVFGATQNPRRKFLDNLKNNAEEYYQIFPFN